LENKKKYRGIKISCVIRFNLSGKEVQILRRKAAQS
jgi:hypothetical protein